MKKFFFFLFCWGHFFYSFSQGSLFIIGGGDRPPKMIDRMITGAKLRSSDHIAVLTMSSASPDTSFYYITQDMKPYTDNKMFKLHFTKSTTTDTSMLRILRTARLIFITGGVQTRFMDIVMKSPVYQAIHDAYDHGSMIAGTSAGAAVMSEIMITGDQIRADTIYEGSVDRLVKKNIETRPGLGFLKNSIIDQHFVVRSRYNRLLTLLSEYPDKKGVGIDEATAIFVNNGHAEVIGESQVILFSTPKNIESSNKIKIGSLRMRIFTEGDKFKIK